MKTFTAKTAGEWRRWLKQHHASASEVWLVFFKKHTGISSVAYEDAVDEALCFGWIDSLVKRLDDKRYVRKFTPRKANSVWSESNRTRYAKLKARGRLKSAGVERAPTHSVYFPGPRPTSRIPRYVGAALRAHPAASQTFEALPPSNKRRYVQWIDSAKREDTKVRRLNETIRLLESGKPLGLK